jgi:hypothetical protein
MQMRRLAGTSQWFVTVLSGSITLGYSATATGDSAVGHLSATATGLVTQRHSTVPMTECRMTGDKIRRAHAVEDIIDYS